MESVARQFAFNQHSMVLRNGWFSYRWTEIFDMISNSQGNMTCTCPNCPNPNTQTSTTTHTVLSAEPIDTNDIQPQYQPMPIDKVLEYIEQERPKVFFCPHVETSTGIILPDEYIQQIATKMHSINGLFVLDCIASGCIWVDMEQLGIDVVISAPQKGWSGPPCVALVMLSQRAMDVMNDSTNQHHIETSFSLSLKRWSAIMDAYNKGGFAYHTTMPTDALRDFHQVTVELLQIGLPKLKQQQLLLGQEIRSLFNTKYELKSVAYQEYGAPGVLVYYSPGSNSIDNPVMMSSFRDIEKVQIAMGVPWKLQYEPIGLKTFRIGLFGIDKLMNINRVKATLDTSLYNVIQHLHTTYNIPLPSSMK
jgi:alanine-glyoxylate transaminase / serine-glyoxylate transaminase / serine-pyruvate transaminase